MQAPLECVVCFAELNEPTVLACQHAHCHQCIINWFGQCNTKGVAVTCPACRHEVTDAERKALCINPILKELMEANARLSEANESLRQEVLIKREIKTELTDKFAAEISALRSQVRQAQKANGSSSAAAATQQDVIHLDSDSDDVATPAAVLTAQHQAQEADGLSSAATASQPEIVESPKEAAGPTRSTTTVDASASTSSAGASASNAPTKPFHQPPLASTGRPLLLHDPQMDAMQEKLRRCSEDQLDIILSQGTDFMKAEVIELRRVRAAAEQVRKPAARTSISALATSISAVPKASNSGTGASTPADGASPSTGGGASTSTTEHAASSEDRAKLLKDLTDPEKPKYCAFALECLAKKGHLYGGAELYADAIIECLKEKNGANRTNAVNLLKSLGAASATGPRTSAIAKIMVNCSIKAARLAAIRVLTNSAEHMDTSARTQLAPQVERADSLEEGCIDVRIAAKKLKERLANLPAFLQARTEKEQQKRQRQRDVSKAKREANKRQRLTNDGKCVRCEQHYIETLCFACGGAFCDRQDASQL